MPSLTPDTKHVMNLIIGGIERGTAFTELVDPQIQRDRLTEQSLLAWCDEMLDLFGASDVPVADTPPTDIRHETTEAPEASRTSRRTA